MKHAHIRMKNIMQIKNMEFKNIENHWNAT